MTDKNWSQIGDEIEDMVRKALESRDFGKLSQDLSRTVGEAMENVGKSVQDAVNKANDKTREATERYSDRADRTADAHSRTEKSTDRPVYSGTVEGKGTSSSGQTSYEYSRSTMRSTRFQLDAGAVLFQVILVGAFHDNGCIVGSGKVQETGKQGFFAKIAAVLRVETDLLLFQLIHGNDLVDGVIFPGHPGCDLPVCLRMEHRVKSHRIKLCSVAVCRFLSQFQDQAAVNSTRKCQAGVSLRIFIQKCF